MWTGWMPDIWGHLGVTVPGVWSVYGRNSLSSSFMVRNETGV